MFKTWLTETLGIKYPIIQGAMQWLSRAELASAVSNAGGLGILSAITLPTAEEFRQEIRKMRELTDKPFAVNITLLPARRPINWDEYINAAIEEGVTIFETAGRSPEPYMAWFKEAEAKVIHKVARIRDARKAEQLGVDAVTVVGFEGGGHLSMEDVSSLVRIPICVDAVKIPVIAAGGFGDGRGLVAALALGAEGVLMATRFMASQECPLHPEIKELLLQTDEAGTLIIERSIRNTARVIRTDYSRKILEMEERGASLEELIPWIDGLRAKRNYASGHTDDSIIYCGQVAGLLHEIPSVKETMENIMRQAKIAGQRLKSISVTE